MGKINWSSVNKKINNVIASKSIQKRISEAKSEHTKALSYMAAMKFIEVLQNTIVKHEGDNHASGELSRSAVDRLKKWKYGRVKKIYSENYGIEVTFDGETKVLSLYPKTADNPDGYDGFDYDDNEPYNIVKLLNFGYSASRLNGTPTSVYGVWKEHTTKSIPSLNKREGAHFLEEAVMIFLRSYAKEYGVRGIVIDNNYEFSNVAGRVYFRDNPTIETLSE